MYCAQSSNSFANMRLAMVELQIFQAWDCPRNTYLFVIWVGNLMNLAYCFKKYNEDQKFGAVLFI